MFTATESGILLPPAVGVGVGVVASGPAVTFDSLQTSTFLTLNGSKLTATANGGSVGLSKATQVLSGKKYWEVLVGGSSFGAGASWAAGIITAAYNVNQTLYAQAGGSCYRCDNRITQGISTLTNTAVALGAGAVVGIEFDATAGSINYYRNNVLQLTVNSMGAGPFYPAIHCAVAGNNATIRPNSAVQSYPTRTGGYVALQ